MYNELIKYTKPRSSKSKDTEELALGSAGRTCLFLSFFGLFILSGTLFADEKLIINAMETRLSQGVTVLEGNVRFFSHDNFLITADHARYNTEQASAELVGNVKIDFYSEVGIIEISSQHVTYNFETSTGIFTAVQAQFGDDFHFSGESIESLPDGSFLISHGELTSCNQANPQWSIVVATAVLEQEGYSRIKHASFRIKGVPVFYFPYLILPTMQTRRSGLLFPETGTSQRNGSYLKVPFYWAPRPDVDLTLTPGYFDRAGISLNAELRYHIRPDMQGSVQGFYVYDKVVDELTPVYEAGQQIETNRFRYSVNHRQKAGKGALIFKAEQGSDYQVEWNFVEDINSGRNRDFFYDLWYGKSWKGQYLSLRLNQNKRIFLDQGELGLIRELPALNWVIPTMPIGAGLYLRSNLHLSLFEHNYYDATDSSPGLRYSVDTEVKKAAQIGPYLFTNFGVSLLSSGLKGEKDIADRNPLILAGTFEVFGPKLHKSYRNDEIDHIISYGVGIRFNDIQNPLPDLSLQFDETDVFIGEQIEGLDSSWLVRSSIFSRRSGTAKSLVEIEMRKKVNTESRTSPLEIAIRVPAFKGMHFNSLMKYKTDENEFDLLSFYGSVIKGNWTGYAGYVKRQTSENDQDSIILRSNLAFPDYKSRVQIALDYDFLRSEFKSQEIAYTISGQCMNFKIAYLETPDAGATEKKKWYRLVLQFKNLGEIGSKL